MNLKDRGSALVLLIFIKYAFLHLHRSATTSGTAVLALGLEPDRTRKMDSGYSSLSTTLAFKNFPEDDAKRFHKLSLIRESQADGAASTAAAETNGEENKWKNRFEGVFHHKPPRGEDSSLSDAESDSSEATTCKYLDTSSSLFSPAPEPDLTPGNRLSSSREVCTGGEGEQRDEWRRSGSQWEEPAAPAEREGAALRLKSLWQQSAYDNSFKEEEDDSERFTGVFQATLVELDSDPLATPSTPPASPDSDSLYQFEMDNLVDTLKSMGPSMRPRATVPRPPAPNLMSSLPPIVEDSQSPVSLDLPDFSGAATRRESLERKPAEPLNGLYTLPADLGLRSTRDTRSLLDLMKQNQQVEKLLQLSLSLMIFQEAHLLFLSGFEISSLYFGWKILSFYFSVLIFNGMHHQNIRRQLFRLKKCTESFKNVFFLFF